MLSAQKFSVIRAEKCYPHIYDVLHNEDVNDYYCDELTENFLDVRSVISPEDYLLKNYASITISLGMNVTHSLLEPLTCHDLFSFTLACLVFASTVIRTFLPNEISPATIYTERQLLFRSRVALMNRGRERDNIEGLIEFLYRYNVGKLRFFSVLSCQTSLTGIDGRTIIIWLHQRINLIMT